MEGTIDPPWQRYLWFNHNNTMKPSLSNNNYTITKRSPKCTFPCQPHQFIKSQCNSPNRKTIIMLRRSLWQRPQPQSDQLFKPKPKSEWLKTVSMCNIVPKMLIWSSVSIKLWSRPRICARSYNILMQVRVNLTVKSRKPTMRRPSSIRVLWAH